MIKDRSVRSISKVAVRLLKNWVNEQQGDIEQKINNLQYNLKNENISDEEINGFITVMKQGYSVDKAMQLISANTLLSFCGFMQPYFKGGETTAVLQATKISDANLQLSGIVDIVKRYEESDFFKTVK